MKISVLFAFLVVLNLVPNTLGIFRIFGRDIPADMEATMPDDPAEKPDDPAEKPVKPAAKAFVVTKDEKTTPTTYMIHVSPDGIKSKEFDYQIKKKLFTASTHETVNFHVTMGPGKKCKVSVRLRLNDQALSRTYLVNNNFWTESSMNVVGEVFPNDKVYIVLVYRHCTFLNNKQSRFTGHLNGTLRDKEENGAVSVTNNENMTSSIYRISVLPDVVIKYPETYHLRKGVLNVKSYGTYNFDVNLGPKEHCHLFLSLNLNNKALGKTYAVNKRFWKQTYINMVAELRPNDKIYIILGYRGCTFIKDKFKGFTRYHNEILWDDEEVR